MFHTLSNPLPFQFTDTLASTCIPTSCPPPTLPQPERITSTCRRFPFPSQRTGSRRACHKRGESAALGAMNEGWKGESVLSLKCSRARVLCCARLAFGVLAVLPLVRCVHGETWCAVSCFTAACRLFFFLSGRPSLRCHSRNDSIWSSVQVGYVPPSVRGGLPIRQQQISVKPRESRGLGLVVGGYMRACARVKHKNCLLYTSPSPRDRG